MVRLYIWKPTKASEVLGEGLMPDFGHAAMEVVDEATGRATYMSFWPELESLVGVATRPWKRREKRNPSTYEEASGSGSRIANSTSGAGIAATSANTF
jgi:hypothetical protein